jgi:transaldolase
MDGGSVYDEALRQSLAKPAVDPRTIYDEIAMEDVRNASDVLRPICESTDGTDGFVSIEPRPQLTRDTATTIQESKRIYQTLNRNAHSFLRT